MSGLGCLVFLAGLVIVSIVNIARDSSSTSYLNIVMLVLGVLATLMTFAYPCVLCYFVEEKDGYNRFRESINMNKAHNDHQQTPTAPRIYPNISDQSPPSYSEDSI
jgi:hypothetical protein